MAFQNSLSSCDSPNLIEILREPLKSHKKRGGAPPPFFPSPLSNTWCPPKALLPFVYHLAPRWQADLFFKSASQTKPRAEGKGVERARTQFGRNSSSRQRPFHSPFPATSPHPPCPPRRGSHLLREFVERKRPTSWLDLTRVDSTRLHLAHLRLSSRKVNALPHVSTAESPYHTYTRRAPLLCRIVLQRLVWFVMIGKHMILGARRNNL